MGLVIAGIDCSDTSTSVLRWSRHQAELTGAPLATLMAWGDGLPKGAQGRDLDVASSARAALSDAVEAALPEADRRDVEQTVLPDEPAKALVARSAEADLIVLGRRHRHFPPGFASVTAKVLAAADCPVAVVGDVPPPSGQVVVGLDGSACSRLALRWGLRQAAATGSELVAVMAWVFVPEYAEFPYGRNDAELRKACEQQLDTELADIDPGAVSVRRRAIHGHPADVLIDLSREAGLLVVGSSGVHTMIGRALGSIAQRVALHADCPVVVVPASYATG